MEIIHILAETLNNFITYVFLLLQKFLHLNYTFVSFILKCLQDSKETALEYILPILNILRCYYQDLIIFLYEVIDIIRFLVNATISILHSICIKFIYVVNNFTDILYSLYQTIAQCFIAIKNSVLQAYDLTTYLIQLIFNSFILILQLIPNLLILLFYISKICCYYVLEMLLNSAKTFTENICYISSGCTEVVYSIPLKAYIGALLLAVIFHQRKIVLKYLKAYFALLLLLLLEIGNNMLYITFICLKPVTRMTINTYRALKCLLFFKETQTVNEENSFSRTRRNSKLMQKYKLLQQYSLGMKNFLKKYLIRGKHAEEQIEQLQKELIAEREKHMCIICFDRPRSIIMHPCRHMCICEECSTNWFTNLQRCPLCRQTIFDVYSVYT